MTTAAPSAALAAIQPVVTGAERVALAGFLAGYRGLTREAYALDLRQFTTWCRARSLALFAVRRAGIEGFAADLEAKGRARATVTRRLSAIAGSCKYAVEEELLGTSPAAHVSRPRVDYESHAVALDRNELGALLAAAGLGPPAGHALISLLALNGLRYRRLPAPASSTWAPERGHRTLTITRKGRHDRHHLARAAHGTGARPGHRRAHRRAGVPGRRRAAAGPAWRRADRPQGRAPGRDRQDRHAPHAAARVHHRRAGRRGAAAGRAGGRLARRSADGRCGTTAPAAARTGTQPTSPPPTSQAPPGNHRRPGTRRPAATTARRRFTTAALVVRHSGLGSGGSGLGLGVVDVQCRHLSPLRQGHLARVR
jgi:Phage integrase, N-terminal SAM-like domain